MKTGHLKAEFAAEERARREETHSRSLLKHKPAKSSKGLSIIAKMGFRRGCARARGRDKGTDSGRGKIGKGGD